MPYRIFAIIGLFFSFLGTCLISCQNPSLPRPEPIVARGPTGTVTPSYSNGGNVTTLAGSAGVVGSNNGSESSATFDLPVRAAVDSSGNLYVADQNNEVIRKISGGVVSTLAGEVGVTGSTNGAGATATFSDPRGVDVDSSGNVYVADADNDLIREISPGGVVTTLAGSAGVTGATNGPGATALFNSPYGVAVDSSGNVYVSDRGNSLIRKITQNGGVTVTTLAGSGTAGFVNGTGTSAQFNYPIGIAVDSSGNVYVGDTDNVVVRKITPAGVVTTLAGSGSTGDNNGTGTTATFTDLTGIAVDGLGNVYVADSGNNMIRVISSLGVVSTLAGQTTAGSADGKGTAASFDYPTGVAVNSAGTVVYVADKQNDTIREIQ